MKETSQSKRLLLWLGCGNVLILLFILSQNSEENIVDSRIKGREDRLISVRKILSENPQLVKTKSKTEVNPKKLSTIINEVLTNQHLTHKVVSQTPSADIKKNEEVLKLQLKDIRFKEVVVFLESINQHYPKVREIDMDMSGGESNDRWKFTASWVMPAQ
jgi:type II secretory pathway component PulM